MIREITRENLNQMLDMKTWAVEIIDGNYIYCRVFYLNKIHHVIEVSYRFNKGDFIFTNSITGETKLFYKMEDLKLYLLIKIKEKENNKINER